MINYFKDLRNWLHIYIALTLGYDITMLFGFPNRENFPFDWRLFLCPIVSGVLVWIGAFKWEQRQDKIQNGSSDERDIWCSAISAYLGGFIALFYPELAVCIISTLISLVIVINELKNK